MAHRHRPLRSCRTPMWEWQQTVKSKCCFSLRRRGGGGKGGSHEQGSNKVADIQKRWLGSIRMHMGEGRIANGPFRALQPSVIIEMHPEAKNSKLLSTAASSGPYHELKPFPSKQSLHFPFTFISLFPSGRIPESTSVSYYSYAYT